VRLRREEVSVVFVGVRGGELVGWWGGEGGLDGCLVPRTAGNTSSLVSSWPWAVLDARARLRAQSGDAMAPRDRPGNRRWIPRGHSNDAVILSRGEASTSASCPKKKSKHRLRCSSFSGANAMLYSSRNSPASGLPPVAPRSRYPSIRTGPFAHSHAPTFTLSKAGRVLRDKNASIIR